VARKAENLEGTRLGGYTLGKLLGAGGMGSVYRATSNAKGTATKPVAIKVLGSEHTGDPTSVERFQREAEAVKRLDHPNVVRILELDAARGHRFIVMELCNGPSFRNLIRDPSQAARIVGILAQVADGLAHAHARGIVHRDVKPDNVLLTRSGKAKVADFGLAKVTDATSLSAQGTIVGTAKYISPEQAQGRKATAASDVYSMGVMLFEAITGEAPFASETHHGFLFQHVAEAPPKPALHAAYPRALGRLALDCLAKEPAERPSIEEVARRLRAVRWGRSRVRTWAPVAVPAAIALVVWLAVPSVLDPVSEGWFGAPVMRALRDASLAIRGLLP
jgi:eukaryotic-like serine/threonine-protein kinase